MTDGSFSAGEVLVGRFRILRFLARGGMGEVYEAEDTELGERVAVKVVRPDIAENDEVMARFRREVQLARRVTHPAVCRIYDLSRHPEGQGVVTLLSMELLQGRTLAQHLARKGPMTVAEAAPIVRQVLGGLAAAHARGIVHGDLKSSNIFLVDEPDGQRAVVTDFGLARLASEAGAKRQPHLRPLMGSLASLAPEVLQGEEPGTLSDIYALGVLLFEMVTARLPFEGKDATELAASRLVEAPPSPRRWAPDLDSRWEEAILRCLAIDPEDRWGDAHQLLGALGLDDSTAVLTGLGQAPRRRGAWRGWLGIAAIATLTTVAVVGWQRPGSEPGPADGTQGPNLATGVPGPGEIPRTASRSDAEQLYWEGMRLHSEFKEAAAIELFQRAVEIDPEFGMAWARLATAYSNMGRPGAREMAARALTLTDQLSPSERHYVRGLYHAERLHELQSALEAFRRALDIDPDNRGARHNLATVYGRLEQYDRALELQQEMVDAGADGVMARSNLAVYLSQTGQIEAAEQILAELIVDNRHNPAPWIHRGLLRLGRGELEDAQRDFEEAVALHPGQAFAELGLCLVDLALGDPRAALARSRLAGRSVEPAAEFAVASCRQLALALGDRSREALDELERSWPSLPVEQRPVIALWRATLHLERGESGRARELAELARSLGPQSWVSDVALFVEGRAALLDGDLDRARHRWREIEGHRDLAPQVARYADLLAAECFLAEGRADRARDLLERILEVLPVGAIATASPPTGQALVWEIQARIALALGRPGEAAECWRRIVDSGTGHLVFPGLYRRTLDHLVDYHRGQGDPALGARFADRLRALEARS